MISQADIANRLPITIAMMLGTIMTSLDTTIANVALPHVQGSLSASVDQITWVLTSYLIATAVMTPMAGWLSARFTRKTVLLISVAGFTVASMLCGAAQNIGEIVVFRMMQGLFAAPLMPLSQAMVLDLWPPRQVAQVMSIWGMTMILGPIVGPTLGGWLTDDFSWRWVFYINLPVGVLTFIGLWLFMEGGSQSPVRRFDFIGFGALSIAVGSAQLLLDRGPTVDWFSASECWVYLVISGMALYVFAVQTLTAAHPFVPRALALDRNFVISCMFGLFLGVMMFASMALLPPMMQTFMGYTALQSGIVGISRGVGTFFAMFIVGRMAGRMDIRALMATGFTISACSLWMMTGFDLSMDATPMIISGLVQGFGMSLIFMPMSLTAFSTLNPALRADAAGIYNLLRSLGGSAGISIMQAVWTTNAAVAHAGLAEHIQPVDPVVRLAWPTLFSAGGAGGDGGGGGTLALLNGDITRQAAMVAYIDDFKLMMVLSLLIIPFLFLLRPAKRAPEAVHALSE